MNYIRHLNAFFSLVRSDQRLTASHVSLYIALFHYWNFNRFNNPFSIYRENIMELCKLSINTYYKCLKELHTSQYIYYFPASNRFSIVRISIIHLDSPKEQPGPYKQLKLFSNGNEIVEQSHNIGTGSVSNLIPQIHKSDTDTVLNLRHLYKLNINKQENNVCKTHPQVFLNENISTTYPDNIFGEDPSNKPIPGSKPATYLASNKTLKDPPSPSQVRSFFHENNYPSTEADKFFHYNQSKNWMLNEKFYIKDWKSLAHKWMLNSPFSKVGPEGGRLSSPFSKADSQRRWPVDLQTLFSEFLSGQNISKLLRPEHFDELLLTLTDKMLSLAKQRRINQLSGSNERSELDLLYAYTSNENKHLLTKDLSNLTSLAKRLAILNHFETLKSEGKTSLQP